MLNYGILLLVYCRTVSWGGGLESLSLEKFCLQLCSSVTPLSTKVFSKHFNNNNNKKN